MNVYTKAAIGAGAAIAALLAYRYWQSRSGSPKPSGSAPAGMVSLTAEPWWLTRDYRTLADK